MAPPRRLTPDRLILARLPWPDVARAAWHAFVAAGGVPTVRDTVRYLRDIGVVRPTDDDLRLFAAWAETPILTAPPPGDRSYRREIKNSAR